MYVYNSSFTVLLQLQTNFFKYIFSKYYYTFPYKRYHNLLLNFWSDKKIRGPGQIATSNAEFTGFCLHLVCLYTRYTFRHAFCLYICTLWPSCNVKYNVKAEDTQTPLYLSQINEGSEQRVLVLRSVRLYISQIMLRYVTDRRRCCHFNQMCLHVFAVQSPSKICSGKKDPDSDVFILI